MGIYDRDYYRREGPSFLDSFSVRGQVVFWIMAINVVLFFAQVATREQGPIRGMRAPGPITTSLELIPEKVLSGEVWRLVTYAFIHDDGTRRGSPNFFTHILFNMWMFFLFAGYLEDLYGRWEFLCFYLVAAVAGGVAYMIGAALEGAMNVPCLGASGAVTATLILCAFHYPHQTILLFFILPVPLWVLAIFHVVQDTMGFLTGGDGNTAFTGHLGGAAFALAYYKAHLRFMSFLPDFRSWKLARSRPKFRVYRGEEEPIHQPVPVGVPDMAELDEQLEAKVDAVLAKVARSGKDSLTPEENQLLLKASEIYKRRRS